jgi:DNA-binding NarL/FixJ family response regulator
MATDLTVQGLTFSSQGADYAFLSYRPTAFQHTLTKAEHAVATAIVRGLSNAEIAAERGVSARTVANQVARLLRKTNTTSRGAMVRWLVRGDGAPRTSS